MIYSMTGFGRVVRNFGDITVIVEVKSLNSKSLDLKMRVPVQFREKEMELRRMINNDIERGKVDFILEIITPDGRHDFGIDQQVFKAYYHELNALAEELNIPKHDLLYTITRLPEVIKPSEDLVSEDIWKNVETVVNEAFTAFKLFRRHDGEPIERDFRMRIGEIQDLIVRVGQFEEGRLDKIRERLNANLQDWVKKGADENRLEQEMVFYVEKFDFTEEKSRLYQHCEYFMSELNGDDYAIGRKLGFIIQEMGREINTLGAKANSADIQRLVVQMKDEMEKVKEQLANIL